MKFTDYVNDGPAEHRKEISEHKFLELLRERAKNSHLVAKKNPIYRKDKGPEIMIVTPAAREEKSNFWVDKLINEMSAWKRYPSRTHFVRGYTDLDKVGGGDDIYVIIPLDTTRIGVCPTDSFYRSFEDTKKTMQIEKVDNDSLTEWLNTLIEGLSKIVKEDGDGLLDSKDDSITFVKFRKTLEKIDLLLKKHQITLQRDLSSSESVTEKQAKILKDLISRHVSTTAQYLREKLDPETNGFTVAKIESLSEAHSKKEVWVDSPCLFIKRSKYIELHKQGDIK